MKKILEICCDTLESALLAEEAGADRIELCEDLAMGGVTPSIGKIWQLKQYLKIPVVVLIRPRPGNFFYSIYEKELMLEDVNAAVAQEVDGIVCGGLLPNGMQVDVAFGESLKMACKDVPLIFHKAFDWVRDPIAAIEQICGFGASRILTSAQQSTALDGLDDYPKLIAAAKGRLEIMAGGGIRPNNLAEISQIEGLSDFHSAARKWTMHKEGSLDKRIVVDEKMVFAMRRILDSNS